jgi:hypothetical protein
VGGAAGTARGAADPTGVATIDDVASGPDGGVVRVRHAGTKPSTTAYFGVDQVFTGPAAG